MSTLFDQALFSTSNALAFVSPSCFGGIFYHTGALYLGEVSAELKREGVGLFFSPFCGFTMGSFSRDLLEGRAVVKDPNGDFGVCDFVGGMAEGPAVKFRWARQRTRREVYERGRLTQILSEASVLLTRDTHEEFSFGEEILERFLERLSRESLFGVLSSPEEFYLGGVERGRAAGVGIRFCRGLRVEKGLFQDGRCVGLGQTLLPRLAAVFEFRGLIERSTGRLEVSLRDGSRRGEAATSSEAALEWLIDGLRRTGAEFAGEDNAISVSLDPDAMRLPRSRGPALARKFRDAGMFYHPEVVEAGFGAWLENWLYPLHGLADPALCRHEMTRPSGELLGSRRSSSEAGPRSHLSFDRPELWLSPGAERKVPTKRSLPFASRSTKRASVHTVASAGLAEFSVTQYSRASQPTRAPREKEILSFAIIRQDKGEPIRPPVKHLSSESSEQSESVIVEELLDSSRLATPKQPQFMTFYRTKRDRSKDVYTLSKVEPGQSRNMRRQLFSEFIKK